MSDVNPRKSHSGEPQSKSHSQGDPTPEIEGLRGTVSRLRTEERRNDIVLHGVIDAGVRGTRAFVMRGNEVRGIVQVGDRIRVMEIAGPAQDGIAPVTRLENLTTHSGVAVWSPPLTARLRRLTGPFLISAVIGPAVGALMTLLIHAIYTGGSLAEHASPPRGGEPSSPLNSPASTFDVKLALALAVTLAIPSLVVASLYKRRKRRLAKIAFLRAVRNQAVVAG